MREFLLRSYTDDEAEVCKRVGLEEVVRCKDCIYGDTNEMGLKLNNAIRCNIHDDGYEMHEPDWFCADGEKKEKEDALDS